MPKPKRKPFASMTRGEQRQDLLRRMRSRRREIEQYLTDLEAFNDILKARGEEPLPKDLQMVRLLADLDQSLKQIEESK